MEVAGVDVDTVCSYNIVSYTSTATDQSEQRKRKKETVPVAPVVPANVGRAKNWMHRKSVGPFEQTGDSIQDS